MTPAIVYNASIGIGTALVGVGAGAAFGWPFGLMATGAMMVVLAVAALWVR
jgi:hypothetical protein